MRGLPWPLPAPPTLPGVPGFDQLAGGLQAILAAAGDPTIVAAVLGAVSLVGSGLATLAGVRYTARQSRAAAEATNRLESTKVSAEAYAEAKKTWTEHVDSLREQVRDLAERLRVLEEQRDRDAELIRRLHRQNREVAQYARDLLRILAHHNIEYPAPPVEL